MLPREGLWELIIWSLQRKCFDLLLNSLNLFFKEMHEDQNGEFICGHWGLKGNHIESTGFKSNIGHRAQRSYLWWQAKRKFYSPSHDSPLFTVKWTMNLTHQTVTRSCYKLQLQCAITRVYALLVINGLRLLFYNAMIWIKRRSKRTSPYRHIETLTVNQRLLYDSNSPFCFSQSRVGLFKAGLR